MQNTPAYLNSGRVLPPGPPFSEAVRVGDTVYFSGQIGNLPGTFGSRQAAFMRKRSR